MRIAHLMLLAMLWTAACSPSASAVSTAIAQTQAAVPTATLPSTDAPTATTPPTATTVPLSAVDLEPLLLADGDLPASFVGGQVSASPPEALADLPAAAQVIHRELRAGNFSSDGVTIALYDSADDLSAAFGVASSYVGGAALADIGEHGRIRGSGTDIAGATAVRLAFVRCAALVVLQLYSPEVDSEVTKTYAQRLDRRLEPVVCP